MTAGEQAAEEESLADGPSAPDGRLRRAGRALWRHRLVTGAAVLVLVAGGVTAGLTLTGGYGEIVSGPSGGYPAPLAASAQARIVARFYGPVRLDDGLAIVGSGNRVRAPQGAGMVTVASGIAAVSLRTGRLYWSYERPGHGVVAVSAQPGGVSVLWDDGLLVQMNARTAVIGWHHGLSADAAAGAAVGATGSGSQGRVLVVSSRGISAVSQATGSTVWSAQAGKCAFGSPALTADSIVVVIEPDSNGGCDNFPLRSYDLATGRVRWQSDLGIVPPVMPLGADTVVAGVDGTCYVINATSGRKLRAIGTGDIANSGDGDGDGLIFASGYAASASADSSPTTFTAWDASTGRLVWRHAVPHGDFLVGGPYLMSAGQAYVVTGSAGPQIPDGLGDGKTVGSTRLSLQEYQASTGSLLASMPLPVLNLAGGTALDETQIQEGASVVPQYGTKDLFGLTETSPYEEGLADAGDPFATGTLPTIVLAS
jgi:hypothetical protein